MLTVREKIFKAKKRVIQYAKPFVGRRKIIFVGGEQRSGTNFLAHVLNKCPQVECYLENDEEAFDNYVLRDYSLLQLLCNKSNAEVVVFKSICDSQNIAALLEHFKGSMAIWAFRNYSDVINSSLKNFSGHRKYLYYMLNNPLVAGWRLQNVMDDDLELVRYYYDKGINDASSRALIWYLRNSLLFQQGLDTDARVLITKYEDLVTFPKEHFKKVFSFIGIENNQRASKNAFASSMGKEPPQNIEEGIKIKCDELYEKLCIVYDQKNSSIIL